MSTIITRVGYCPICANEHRPRRGNVFLVYGSFRGKYYTREAMRDGTEGYTPHMFILNRVTKDNICIIETVCCMHGCAVQCKYSTEKHIEVYCVIKDRWETIFMSTPDWNALVLGMKRDKQWQI